MAAWACPGPRSVADTAWRPFWTCYWLSGAASCKCHAACWRPPALTWERTPGCLLGWARLACQLACREGPAESLAPLQRGSLQMGKLLRDSGQVGRAGTLALSSRPAGWEHTHAGPPVREACCCHTGAVPLHGTASVTAAQLQTFISSSNQMRDDAKYLQPPC